MSLSVFLHEGYFSTKFRIAIAILCGTLSLVDTNQVRAEYLTPSQVSTEPWEDSSSFLQSNSSYTLGPEDIIYIEVFNIPNYSREYRVLSDGTVSLPLVGPLQVRGMTVNQASEAATLRYAYYIRRPFISVELRQVRPIQIAIAGEVNRPGSYTLASASEAGSLPTVTSAIQLAGGITQSADIRSISVYRSESRAALDPKVINISLWELIKEGDLEQDLQLRDGDSITVPRTMSVSSEEMLVTASASFSPSTIKVYVVGEVIEAGVQDLPPSTPLNQAILAAGGFNTRAARNLVTLIRLNLNGTVSQREIEVDFEQGVNEESNPALRSGDTIVVRRSGLSSVTDVLGSVLSPISGIFNIFRLLNLD